MKRILMIVIMLFISSVSFAKKDEQVIRVPAGSNIPQLGMALDASYDSSLDGVVPGFKILTIAITNNSIDIINFNIDLDEWEVSDLKGKKHEAVINLKIKAPQSYSALDEKRRRLLAYPMMLQVGETRTIDIFFKDSVSLDGFRAVRFKSAATGKIIEIVAQE